MTLSKDRMNVLRNLLASGEAATQEDLREGLARKGFAVTQSTISRDLRRLSAIRTVDPSGRMTYRLPEDVIETPLSFSGDFSGLVQDIQSNGSLIVIHTSPGSASLVARQLDSLPPGAILGTIAGDDTIFVAPASAKNANAALKLVRTAIGV